MHRLPVDSSSIDSIGYERNVLEVGFRNGGVYQYFDVAEEALVKLMRADSKGAFFNQSIRGRYPSKRLVTPRAHAGGLRTLTGEAGVPPLLEVLRIARARSHCMKFAGTLHTDLRLHSPARCTWHSYRLNHLLGALTIGCALA